LREAGCKVTVEIDEAQLRSFAEAGQDRSRYHDHRAAAVVDYQVGREDVSRTVRQIEWLEADLRRYVRELDGTPSRRNRISDRASSPRLAGGVSGC